MFAASFRTARQSSSPLAYSNLSEHGPKRGVQPFYRLDFLIWSNKAATQTDLTYRSRGTPDIPFHVTGCFCRAGVNPNAITEVTASQRYAPNGTSRESIRNNHIKEPMKDIAPDTAEIGAVALDLPLYGISLAMFTNTIVALMQRCSSADRKMMVVASAYLLLSTAHAITGIVRLNNGFIHSRDTFSGGPPKFFSNGIETGFLIQGMIYIVETLLTDAVVIYRCFKVWRRWTVIVLPIMLWCLALASGLGLWSALGPAAVAHGGPGVSIFKYAKWIKALFASTLATNLISTAFALPAVLEVAFYAVAYHRRKNLQRGTHKPPVLDAEQREALFAKCSHSTDYPNYPFGWFSSPELKRENFVEWILWALFSCDPQDALEEWNEEIERYIKKFEEITGTKLEDGRADWTTSLRLMLDPVQTSHRPLLWYFLVAVVDLITCVKLHILGFQHYSQPRVLTQVFPPRFYTTIFSEHSTAKHFSYWYRPHRSKHRDPVVFIHGIGIGLYPYVPLINSLIQLDPEIGILLIELLPISMHITAEPIPQRRDLLDALYAVIHRLGMSRAVLAAHSYGTVIAAHIIRDDDPGAEMKKPIITAFLLIDPIPILLHLPNVAFNFLYRIPGSPNRLSSRPRVNVNDTEKWAGNEWQLWYFASQDPDIAYTLARGFFWAENILWREDLGLSPLPAAPGIEPSVVDGRGGHHNRNDRGYDTKFAVVLSGDDQIVPSDEVWQYLTGMTMDEVSDRERVGLDTTTWKSDNGMLEVLYYHDIDHAMVFDTKKREKGLIRILDEFTSVER
ncbi:hypothetical protein D9757_011859 [Collybiopsis confluens]|uniref:AB hydrolase-1 domain-containing protein n=1 Tax=Collybiopsis confluens TaxID=2823264 RepID=A0A8H5D3L2_9AGAR|nr:hypothetical protein D9757_011859 [Collybiopsis confluens]